MIDLGEVLKWVGGLTLGGTAATLIAYEAFKHLSAKLLDEKFETRLEKMRHQQEIELARVQAGIDRMIDRATKLHQAEFEVLPKVWELINAAYWGTMAATSRLRSYPDFGGMTTAQRVDLLERLEWPAPERNLLLVDTPDAMKQSMFQELYDRHKHQDAMEASRNANTYVLMKGLFIEPALTEKIKAVDDLVWNALNENGINLSPEMRTAPRKDQLHDAIDRLHKEGKAMMEDLLKAFQARIWSEPEGERQAA